MKKLLLLPALLVSAFAFAQKYEIGLNMGMSISSAIDYPMPGSTSYNSRGGFSPYVSGKFLYDHGHMQYGIGTDFVMPHTSYKDLETGATAKVFYAHPLVPIYGIANRTFNVGKNGYFYGGGSLGIGYSSYNSSFGSGKDNQYSVSSNSIMPLIGAQLGYTQYFGRVGLNAELGAKWLPDISGSKTTYGYSIYSGTIGLRYRFGK